MNWLARLVEMILDRIPDTEGDRLAVDSEEYWVLSGVDKFDLYRFLQEVHRLTPDGSCICFQGTSMARDVEHYLSSRSVEPRPIMTGTKWPKAKEYHLPLTPGIIAGLADLAEHHAEPEVCDHIVVYQADNVFLEWWDVPDEPIILSPNISEPPVQEFCRLMGCSYEFIDTNN